MNTAKKAEKVEQMTNEIAQILGAKVDEYTPAALLLLKVQSIMSAEDVTQEQAIKILAEEGENYGGSGELGGVRYNDSREIIWTYADDVDFVILSNMIYCARTNSVPCYITGEEDAIEE